MSEKSDFQTAEEIRSLLVNREKAEQERIVRWVSESLSLNLGTSPASTLLTSTPAGTQPVAPSSAVTLPSPAPNVKSFIVSKKPTNEIHVAAVIAYFFRFEAPANSRQESMTAASLNDASRQGRGHAFKDALKTLQNAADSGYFDRAGRGNFVLNPVGENLVAMTLSN